MWTVQTEVKENLFYAVYTMKQKRLFPVRHLHEEPFSVFKLQFARHYKGYLLRKFSVDMHVTRSLHITYICQIIALGLLKM